MISIPRNVRTRKALFDPVNVSTLLADLPTSSTSATPTIINATIRPNGTPLIQISSGLACAYDAAFRAWEEVSTAWWAANSPIFARGSAEIVGNIEANSHQGPGAHMQEAWWGEAITLGHLETKLHACALLHSPVEYRANLLEYAKLIANHGYVNKADELLKELYGPIYR
jgi:protein HIRA/HIR1